jgi:hypothetical protein
MLLTHVLVWWVSWTLVAVARDANIDTFLLQYSITTIASAAFTYTSYVLLKTLLKKRA